MAPTALSEPPDGLLADYRKVQERLGLERTVIVQPSAYGIDNTCTLEAMAKLGDNARSVVVVDTMVTNAELEELTGSVWPGAIITCVLFVLAHMGTNGVAEILFIITPTAAALTGLYLWKRNFFFVVIVHFVVDSHLWIRPLLTAIADRVG